MTDFAILESRPVADCRALRAPREHGQSHRLVSEKIFDGKSEFIESLRDTLSILRWHQVDGHRRLLIISGHGEIGKATDLEVGNGESIGWWELKAVLEDFPPRTAVYFSSCFGIYSGASMFQVFSKEPLYIFGPMVDVRGSHANSFQGNLLDALANDGDALRQRCTQLVDKYNGDERLLKHYGGRVWLFGFFDDKRSFHPMESQGFQLAAPVQQYSKFVVEELLRHPKLNGPPVKCLLRDSRGYFYTTPMASALKLGWEIENLKIGARVSATYQISSLTSVVVFKDGEKVVDINKIGLRTNPIMIELVSDVSAIVV